MLEKKFKEKIATIRKGTFTTIKYKSVKVAKDRTMYIKETNGVVRFVKYSHIKSVMVKGSNNQSNTIVDSDCEFLYHNTNTGSALVQLATTPHKNANHCKYYKVESSTTEMVEITKDEYEMANPPRPSNGDTKVFRVKLENIISIGRETN